MIVVEMNKDQVIERQAQTISKLQDKINLLKFETMQLAKERTKLKHKLKNKRENIKNIREEVMTMKRTEDYSRIKNVLAMLHGDWDEEYENDGE